MLPPEPIVPPLRRAMFPFVVTSPDRARFLMAFDHGATWWTTRLDEALRFISLPAAIDMTRRLRMPTTAWKGF